MPRKERTNAKTWERDRRNRMNSYFKTLSDLLPPHQEGRKRNKVDILIYAAKYIKDLTNRTEELFYAHAVDAHKEELNRLKKLVAQLYSRTQLLSTLLKEAGITVPAEPALEKISPLKWSNKINVDDVDKYLDRYNECKKPEKRKNKPLGVRPPSKKKLTSTSSPKKPAIDNDSPESTDIPSEDQENHVSTSITDSSLISTPEIPPKPSETRSNVPQTTTTNTISSETSVSKSGPGIRKLESRKKTKRKTNISIDEKSKKMKDIASQGNKSLGNLIPGTLILSGGKIMPLMTPIPSNILVNAQAQSSNQIILSNTQANSMIVMQSIGSRIQPVRNQNIVNTVQKVTLNTVPSIRTNVGLSSQDWVSNVRTIVEATKIGGRKGILPKGKEITKTTMTYKVPIPAVHREGIGIRNSDNVEKNEPKNRIKKLGKNKKIKDKNSGNKEDKSSDSNLKIEEKCRKRKNIVEDSECSPTKSVKSSLPETCVSIENLRHVVEKIGEENSEKLIKVNREKSESNENSVEISSPSSSSPGASKDENFSPEKSEKLSETTKTDEEIQKKSNSEVSLILSPVLDQNIPKSCESSIVNSSNESSQLKTQLLVNLEPQKDRQTPPLSEVDKVIAEAEVEMQKTKEVCDLGKFDNLLNTTSCQPQVPDDNRILLNLDTNTTTTMKQDTNLSTDSMNPSINSTSSSISQVPKDEKSKEIPQKSLTYTTGNTFVPISRNEALHSDLSNDLFASLQVPSSSHNPESISPTAAFLMAFPLVSSLNGKTEVLEEDMKEDLKYHSQTPPMLLQIGTIEPTIFKPKLNEDKSLEDGEKNKTEQDKAIDTSVSKVLPKIINNEPIKERLYKVVPYSEPSMNIFPNSGISTSQAITSPIVPHSEVDPKKIIQNSLETTSNDLLVTSKPEDTTKKLDELKTIPSSIPSAISSSRTISLSGAVDQIPKYDSNRYPPLPEFVPNYSNFTTSDNQMISNTRVYSSSQIPTSQPVYSYGLEKPQSIASRQTFINRSNKVSMDNQIISYTVSQTRPTTAADDYQTRNINPVMPVSHSLQYNYSSRPKDSYPLQHQDPQRVYMDQSKNSSICQSTYSIQKENPQMTYQDYSIVSSKTSSTTLDSTQLSRTFVKDTPQNYQTYLPITKEQRSNEVQSNLGQNYTNQSKQTIDTFEKHAKNSQETQRIETSISSAVKNSQDHFNANYPNFDNKNKGNSTLIADPLYQIKRSEPQTYALYPREQKKMFENPSNSQIKSNIQSSLPRYHQLQQQPHQQTVVTTLNYGQSTVSDNLGKSTTTVAHNSSNYSILSWTTLSPMGLGNNNNLGHYEGGTDHDDNEGKTICENFNYNQLHKDTVGYGNMISEYPTAEGISLDKTKIKMPHDNKQYEDASKSKNVQTNVISQQKQTRTHNQNPNITDDFKYNENKNKPKYSMDSAYTQTEFTTLDQRHQHPSKTHQIPQSKSDKTYSIPYDSQITFDLPDPVTQSQTKCSDIYTGTNYKYDDKDHSQIKYQPIQTQPPVLNDNVSYNSPKPNHQNMNKSKSVQQQVQQPVRPPVNWMMPETKHNSNISDLILPPIGKELDFCQNNIFSQTPSYNQSTSNQFYNNYDVSVSAAHSFSNVPTLQSDRFYPEEQPFSWSPTKNPQIGPDHQNMKTLDQQVVPSTLPTLVGDLALGTNIPEKQSFLFGQMPPRTSNELAKNPVKEKESNFQVMLNTQTVQHNQGTSFLSVSQLVEHEKAEKTHHQQNHHTHHQTQPRKQRKSNTSPRATGKRQMDMRKQNNDQQMQQHEEQKVLSTHGFSDQYQQQQQQQQQQPQKYQQNDGLWRNRNCKSNYTAEALIGVNNTSIHDGNTPEKQLHTPAIKFSTDYSQNKFSSGLSTTEMVMPPMNYLTNPDDGNGYSQVMNQNFNHSSYTYSPNTNIYPSTNFIAGISNTTSSYMVPLHDNPTDYLETNSFLLPNVSNIPTPKPVINTSSSVSVPTSRATSSVTASANVKNQHYNSNNTGKQHQCDKRNSYSNVPKKSKRKSDATMQNLEFPTGGVAPMEDYHSHHTHTSTFLPPPPHANPLYQNHSIPNANRSRGVAGSGNSVAGAHHPSGTSLTNFNLSTIFPEINDKVLVPPSCLDTPSLHSKMAARGPVNHLVTGYKPPNVIQPGLSQSSNLSSTSYPQRANYTANNSLGHVAQVSEASQFTTDLPVPPPPSLHHYKAT